MVLTGAAVLGLVVAACSSKSTDTGGGGGAGNNSNAGGAGNLGGGTAAATGGKSTSTTDTGGTRAVSNTGGGTGIDLTTYCNGLFNGQVCGTTSRQADVRTVNMLLVLDESGSMNDKASPADTLNKWGIMNAALTSALTSVENDINFGLLLYPYDPAGIDTSTIPTSCSVPNDATAINVPIKAGPDNVAEILSFVGGQRPAGGTPTARALHQAYNYFQTGDGKSLSGSRWVLLATDGGPNCNLGIQCTKDTCTQNLDLQCGDKTATTLVNCCDPSQTGNPNSNMSCLDGLAATSEIANLAAIGVKTFVVGVPGSDPYANTLNTFANAGQMPNTSAAATEQYYAVSAASAQKDLTDAFATITTQLVKTCDIPLAKPPSDISLVNVTIDCQKVSQVPTGTLPDAGVDGYYIDISQSPAHLKLVGAPCNSIMTNGAHNVDVILGCSQIK